MNKRKLESYAKFLSDAYSIANHSKYRNTRVGCVILGPGLEIRSSGWNGACRGCKADEDNRLDNRDEKLLWAVHAEANAISNAARCGTPLQGCVMVCTHVPCMSCAKLVVQAGISAVLCPEPPERYRLQWEQEYDKSKRLFEEVGVKFKWIVEEVLKNEGKELINYRIS